MAQLAIGSEKLHNVVMHKIVVDIRTEGISVGIAPSTAVFDFIIKLSKLGHPAQLSGSQIRCLDVTQWIVVCVL